VAGFDVAAARRWARLDPRRTLARRPDAALPFTAADELAGQPLLLDTCVYIDQMQGRAPRVVEQLIDTRQVNHSTVAIQELMHTIGVLDPDDPRTAAVVEAVSNQIEAMPEHRVFAPDAEVLGRAALLAGIMSRLQGYARDAKLKALQDCVLLLQAQKLGFAILTANIAEFDLLLQLVPTARALFYRPGA
jgi:predicted nucleic acid-binding protein